MSDTNTENIGLVKPAIDIENDDWGGKLNSNFDSLDTAVGEEHSSDGRHKTININENQVVIFRGAEDAALNRLRLVDSIIRREVYHDEEWIDESLVRSCQAVLATNVTLSHDTDTRLPLSVENGTLSGWLDDTDGEEAIIVPLTGTYLLSASIRFNSLGAEVDYRIAIHRDDEVLNFNRSAQPDSGNAYLQATVAFKLDAGDKIWLRARHRHGSNRTVDADAAYTYLCAALL